MRLTGAAWASTIAPMSAKSASVNRSLEAGIAAARSVLRSASSVVCFSGAGLSAESGVPTFRDRQRGGDALWARYDPMTLASPQGFAADPQTVMDWYNWRRRVLSEVQPNAAHRALAAATRSAKHRFHNVTQNVDDLLERAGANDVVHLHGSMTIDHCQRRCGHIEHINLADPVGLRDCPACGSSAKMRPGVVWFGESLPRDAWEAAERVCRACHAILVVGTSAVVYPAAGLIGVAQSSGARIIVVNTELSEASELADVELLGKAGEIMPRLLADIC
jgi:NAD-dependent deacetylase